MDFYTHNKRYVEGGVCRHMIDIENNYVYTKYYGLRKDTQSKK